MSYQYNYETICKKLGCEFGKAYEAMDELKDKLHRRNMQIKDLKGKIKELENIPKEKEFDNNFDDLNEIDLEYIAQQITQGCTSGHNSNGEMRIYWDLRLNAWKV